MENKKISFFKRVGKAITKFEDYSDFAVEKMSVAVKYIAKLTLIFSIILSIVFSFKFSKLMNNEEELAIMRNQLVETSGLNIEAIEEALEYIKSNSNFSFYATLTLSVCIYFFSATFMYAFIDALIISIVGLIASKITRIRLKYKPIYIMSIYALTLPIILNCIYAIANTLTGFNIDYFQIVYNVIAYIYIITAILMIKTDFIEQQQELIKIVEEQRKIRREHGSNEDENKEDADKPRKPEKPDDDKENAPEG